MKDKDLENSKENILEMFSKFLPLAMKIIGIDHLPKMIFEKDIEVSDQPTFGRYVNEENTLYVALGNRHPNDILRTIAHELVHYRQDIAEQLNPDSGETGSPEENEANAIAGVVMRYFNKKYPEYLKSKPIIAENRQGVEEGPNRKQQYIAAEFVDEFADGDRWFVKGTPELIQKFIMLANSIEQASLQGTEYEPSKGFMGKIHSQLGNDQAPRWKIVSATNLDDIRPINNSVINTLSRVNLQNPGDEFMSEFLWSLEEKSLAKVSGNLDDQNMKEGLNELSKDTLRAYSKDASREVGADQRDARSARDQAIHHISHGNLKKGADWSDESDWLNKRAEKRAGGIANATIKIAKKGLEEDTNRRNLLKGLGAYAGAGVVAGAGLGLLKPEFNNETREQEFIAQLRDPADRNTYMKLRHEYLKYLELIKEPKDSEKSKLLPEIIRQKASNIGKFKQRMRKKYNLQPEVIQFTLVEVWSQKYKKSIDCDNPKGFSQRAHCQGRKKTESTNENFKDDRNPQDKGDSKRYNVPTKGKVSTLRKVAKQGGRRGQLAHWMANMKAGKAKKQSK
jgi:hypothetical protein